MILRVRLFAVCRERMRAEFVEVEVPAAPEAEPSISLAELKAALAVAHPPLVDLFPACRFAVQLAFADDRTRIRETDEIAMIPPVSGGSGQGPYALRPAPFLLDEVVRAVSGDEMGALVSFQGTVRDRTGAHRVLGLEYEAYPEMAEGFLRKIGAEIGERWPGARSAILHRVGAVAIGEVSVAIAVASPHRAAAFEACRHAIERIKEDVPIWKRELRADGSVWVGLGS